MTKHKWEPFRAVFDLSLDRLIRILNEAQAQVSPPRGTPASRKRQAAEQRAGHL
jgi:hypothetical protein